MNYKSVFRFLIIVPILFIFVAVGLDFAYPFPESVGSYYGDLAAFGFSWKYNAMLFFTLAAFAADLCLCFFVKNSREIWLVLMAIFFIFSASMPELTIMSPLSIVLVQVAWLMAGIKIAMAYLSPPIRDLF